MSPTQTVTLPDPATLLIRVFVAVLLLTMYTYNFWKSYRIWHTDRDWDSYRQFIMAFELFFGVVLIFTGYVNSAFFAANEQVTGLLRAVTLGLLGVLLVGGFTLVFSWRKPLR